MCYVQCITLQRNMGQIWVLLNIFTCFTILNVKFIRFARALNFIFVQLIFQSTDLQQHIELSVKSLLSKCSFSFLLKLMPSCVRPQRLEVLLLTRERYQCHFWHYTGILFKRMILAGGQVKKGWSFFISGKLTDRAETQFYWKTLTHNMRPLTTVSHHSRHSSSLRCKKPFESICSQRVQMRTLVVVNPFYSRNDTWMFECKSEMIL